MRIYTSDNGSVYANAISSDGGNDVEGHVYQLVSGSYQGNLKFQLGTVPEAGHNGTTNEAVIACVIHRLKYLNDKFPCRENALAITKLEESLMWLEARTKDRVERGVEGRHEK